MILFLLIKSIIIDLIICFNNQTIDSSIVNVSINFLHFYSFLNDEKILPAYAVFSIEWLVETNLKTDDNFLDPKEWLPNLKVPNLFIESNSISKLIDVDENKYQYLIYKDKKLIYITRINFQLKCHVNGRILYPHETKFCHLSINTVFSKKNGFKLNWQNLSITHEYIPGFLIKILNSNQGILNDEQLFETENNLELNLEFKRLLSLQFYQFYLPTIIFALISYSNFFLPIVALSGRFLIISIPLIAILIIYQQVPEFNQYTYIDYWFTFFFFYVLTMFVFFLISLKEYASDLFESNQYQQTLLNKQTDKQLDKQQSDNKLENQSDNQLDKTNKEIAFSNWKTYLKQQTEQRNLISITVSYLKTDQIARYIYASILILFLLIYSLFIFLIKN